MRRGRPPHPELLTPREQEVLAYLRDGLTNAEIAVRLRISPDGVKYHVSEILSKLGVSSRQEAAAWQPRRRPWPAGLLAHLSAQLRWVPFGTPGKIAAGVTLSTLVVIGGIFIADRLQSTAPSDANEPAAASSASLGKLAYVVDGDVWVKALPDGTPVQITRDGIYSFPRWSPSGEWLAIGDTVGSSLGDGRYIRSSLIVRADGSSQRYSSYCGIWSPTRDVLACMRSDNHLVLESPDGALVRDLDIPAMLRNKKDFAVGAVNCYAWSHQDSIACIIYGPLSLQPGAPIGHEYQGIWVVETDGTDAWEVFSNDPLAEGRFPIPFGFSPDGSYVLFGLYPAGGSPGDAVRQLAAPSRGGQITELEGAILPVHVGSGPTPDGATIVSEGQGEQSWTGKRIGRIDLASGDLSYLTGPEATGLFPTWSPDFSQLAYVSAPTAGEIDGLEPVLSGSASPDAFLLQLARNAMTQRRLWLMDRDGGNKRQLTQDSAYRDERPQWSADGSQILFGRIDLEGNASIWMMPSAGGQPEKVVDISRCSKQRSVGTRSLTGCVAANIQSYAAGPFWFGYYGYVAWAELISYWRGPG